MARTKPKLQNSELALRDYALTYPETHEDSPWGERALKVRKKVFVFMSRETEAFSLCVKLPQSSNAALGFSFTEPAGYGMGKYGWVAAKFQPGDDVPEDLLKAWIDESYRAVAPKTLVARLDGES